MVVKFRSNPISLVHFDNYWGQTFNKILTKNLTQKIDILNPRFLDESRKRTVQKKFWIDQFSKRNPKPSLTIPNIIKVLKFFWATRLRRAVPTFVHLRSSKLGHPIRLAEFFWDDTQRWPRLTLEQWWCPLFFLFLTLPNQSKLLRSLLRKLPRALFP